MFNLDFFTSLLGKLLSNFNDSLKSLNRIISTNKLYFTILFLVPILLYFPYYLTSTKIGLANGDFDYFLQNYEAIRKSVLEFHQFPWWNPWSGGGLPLYANPQIGVFSIPAVLSIIFGTILGLKLSIIVFIIAGQVGLYQLLSNFFKTSKLESTLLSFLWVLNGFFVARIPNHFSFIYYLLLPLFLYLQLHLDKAKPKFWLAYATLWILCILGAVHYAIIQMGVFLFVVLLVQLKGSLASSGSSIRSNQLVKNLAKVAVVIIVFTAHRLLYTLQYVTQFPRTLTETTNSSLVLIKGLILPNVGTNFFQPSWFTGTRFGSGEYASGVGIFIMLFLLALVFGGIFQIGKFFWFEQNITVKNKDFLAISLVFGFIFFFVMSMGAFDSLAPYNILKHLPFFGGMQVASRWLIFCVFIVILGLGYLIRNGSNSTLSKATRLVIVLAVIEAVILTAGQDRNLFFRYANNDMRQHDFEQRINYVPPDYYKSQPYGEKKTELPDIRYETFGYEATANNIGVLRGYEPLYDTRLDTQGRCFDAKQCQLIATTNASLKSWTPNKIVIKRHSPGTIILNMVPSSLFLVNGSRVYDTDKILNPGQIKISDESQTIIVEIKPRLLGRMIGRKVRTSIKKIL